METLTYDLGIKDRLIMMQLLPEQGSFLALKSIRKLREDLSLNEQEIAGWGVVQEDTQVTWDEEKATTVPVIITDYLMEKIHKQVGELDRREMLPTNAYDTLVKIGYNPE